MIISHMLPEIILVISAVVCLLFTGRSGNKYIKIIPLALSISAVVSAIVVVSLSRFPSDGLVAGVFIADTTVLLCRLLILSCAGITLAMIARDRPMHNDGLPVMIAGLLCTTAALTTVSGAQHFILVLTCLVLAYLSMGIMLYAGPTDEKILESTLKYCITHFVFIALMIYGISLVYASTGTLDLHVLSRVLSEHTGQLPFSFQAGMVCILAGILGAFGAVPFHTWVPDTVETARLPVAFFLIVATRIALIFVCIRLFSMWLPHTGSHVRVIFSVIAVLTMCVGNLSALFQNNIKRFFAYTSIGHSGFLLMGGIIGSSHGYAGVAVFGVAFVLMYAGIFLTIMLIDTGDTSFNISSYAGLAEKNLFCALLCTIFLLSIGFLPATAGFTGFFAIITAVLSRRDLWLAAVCFINVIAAAYFVFRMLSVIYFDRSETRMVFTYPAGLTVLVVLCAISTIVLGIFPEYFISILGDVAVNPVTF